MTEKANAVGPLLPSSASVPAMERDGTAPAGRPGGAGQGSGHHEGQKEREAPDAGATPKGASAASVRRAVL